MILRARYNLYFSASGDGGGIYHFKSDGSGNIEPVKKYPLDKPMFLIVSGKKLHCILRAPFADSDFSGLVSFDIGENGELLNMTKPQSTKGIVACHLAESDGSIYCVNYLSGSVIKMPDTVDTHSGHGVNPKRQDAPHTHYVCESPDGKYIFVTDLGIDKIFVYNKDLTVRSTVDMPAGHGPRHLICAPDGAAVYCVNELESTLSRLNYSDGTLTLCATVKSLPADFHGTNTAAAIRIDGDRVYISQRGLDAISVMNVADENMSLETVIPAQGNGPRDLWVDEDVFICTNENSDSVTVLDRKDGSLIFKFNMEAPISVICTKA